jgi:hypothetical protein
MRAITVSDQPCNPDDQEMNAMSLDVAPTLVDQAQAGEVDEEEFVRTVERSLPYAWEVCSRVTARLRAGETDGRDFADDATPPPSEQARGQLLRALASDAIRSALEHHFRVRFAFQNCHRVAAFCTADVDGTQYRSFVSIRSQILNQQPGFRDC